MKEYNYRVTFNNGQVTELLRCDAPLSLENNIAKWYTINYKGKEKRITIHTDNVNTIEEWLTESEDKDKEKDTENWLTWRRVAMKRNKPEKRSFEIIENIGFLEMRDTDGGIYEIRLDDLAELLPKRED